MNKTIWKHFYNNYFEDSTVDCKSHESTSQKVEKND